MTVAVFWSAGLLRRLQVFESSASALAPDFPSLVPSALAAFGFIGLARRIFSPLHAARSLCRFCPLLVFYLAGVAAAFAAAPPVNPRLTGTPFLTRWDADDYGGGPVNIHVVQHPQSGFIYVGNNLGVLEFDGVVWRLIPFRDEGSVSIVVIDPRGAVWIGGTNEVAVLGPGAQGDVRPFEVTDRLPANERNFGRLTFGVAGPDGVYFASPSRLLFFGVDGTARSWSSGPTQFSGLCWFDGALHASVGPAGMVRLVEGALVAVAGVPPSPHPAVPATLRLFDARIETDGGALLLTSFGPMRWAARGAPIKPFSAGTAKEFARETANFAAFLPDGRLAFSFLKQGLHILDASGEVSLRLDLEHGLAGSQIERMATDNQGGLWLARINGLARLQLDSRFATHGDFTAPRVILRHGPRLYFAHAEGAAWRDDVTGVFHPIAGLPSGLNSLLNVGDRLFGARESLYEITPDDRAVMVLRLSFNDLIPLRSSPGTFGGASVAGLRLLRFEGGKWRSEGMVASVPGGVRSLFEDNEGWLWATGYSGAGSWRVDFRQGASIDAPAELIDSARGLPFLRARDPLRFASLGGETITMRADSLLRYDRVAARFVAEDRLDRSAGFSSAVETPGGDGDHWWMTGAPTPQLLHMVVAANNRWRVESLPAKPLHSLVPTMLYRDAPTRTLWLAGKGALVSIDPAWRSTLPLAPFHATVRRLATTLDELLWADGIAAPKFASERAGDPVALRPTGGGVAPKISLVATQNSLRFTFAAPTFTPNFRGVARPLFRTHLDGLDDTWTPWSATPWREFTHLPYRSFVFRVQARDVDDRESTVGTLAFTIAPPWWLARPTIAGYAVLTLIGLVGLFRLRTRALERRNAQLESLVAVRTAELERLRRLEMDEKISARLAEEKARLEVLRYQLNPHFLFNSLNSIYTLVWTHSRPAGDLVRRLAEFCRMTLTRGGAETATLSEEFTMLRAYLDLEQVRWQENLQVEFSLAAELVADRLPPFLLLPLVENAVKYGGHTSPDLLRIRVTAQVDAGNFLFIEIANSGTWVEPGSVPAVASTNIGLENLRQRLVRHFPAGHEFTIGTDNGWVVMRLRLPRAAQS